MTPQRMLRTALGLELAGVVLGSFSMARTTPATFLVFVGLAVPCLAAGVVLYLVYLLRRVWLAERVPPA